MFSSPQSSATAPRPCRTRSDRFAPNTSIPATPHLNARNGGIYHSQADHTQNHKPSERLQRVLGRPDFPLVSLKRFAAEPKRCAARAGVCGGAGLLPVLGKSTACCRCELALSAFALPFMRRRAVPRSLRRLQHPTPWRDVAVLTSNISRCEFYRVPAVGCTQRHTRSRVPLRSRTRAAFGHRVGACGVLEPSHTWHRRQFVVDPAILPWFPRRIRRMCSGAASALARRLALMPSDATTPFAAESSTAVGRSLGHMAAERRSAWQ